jgi:hypothetical protein
MKAGDAFVWTDSRYKLLDAFGHVEEVRNTGSVVVNITWPEDQGELREMGPTSSYITRSNLVMYGRLPGSRILETRHEFMRRIWSK